MKCNQNKMYRLISCGILKLLHAAAKLIEKEQQKNEVIQFSLLQLGNCGVRYIRMFIVQKPMHLTILHTAHIHTQTQTDRQTNTHTHKVLHYVINIYQHNNNIPAFLTA